MISSTMTIYVFVQNTGSTVFGFHIKKRRVNILVSHVLLDFDLVHTFVDMLRFIDQAGKL